MLTPTEMEDLAEFVVKMRVELVKKGMEDFYGIVILSHVVYQRYACNFKVTADMFDDIVKNVHGGYGIRKKEE